MEKLQELMNDITEWSDNQFGYGQRNPAILHHLLKEVTELIKEFDHQKESSIDYAKTDEEKQRDRILLKFEFADCFMLLFDSAHHIGISANEIINISRAKLEINKKRKWGKPDKNGVVEHIKD